ncbi:MAG: DNA cytosine methyltransferase [Tannerella sp.]|jgi:DNA (cytosine-5)-methyltransferase 1|nr:DNA cytosine methyltransferase [Tannerella sp.]
MKFISIDLFSGVGGLTEGLRQAGFHTKYAFEIDESASNAYKLNHHETEVITEDIRKVNPKVIQQKLKSKTIHLLAGCPPCQGFSSIRRLNKPLPVYDERNTLIDEYVRFIKVLKPYTFMMENVPGLALHESFHNAKKYLEEQLGYHVDYKTVNVKDYGVPQSRKRLVMVGSRLGKIKVAEPVNEKVTVRKVIGSLPKPELSNDPIHKIFPKHSERITRLIKELPNDGGSRTDLGKEKQLKCHLKENVGFNDVYGRLRWDDYATTITGGCLNPSKGRFLHPEQDRCISAREAALLQSFPIDYKFPVEAPISKIALMIGNALPPKFSAIQADSIKRHLIQYLNG